MNEQIKKIQNILIKYPEVEAKYTDTSVTIPQKEKNGFEVQFHIDQYEYTVCFDGWHDHFEKPEEAIDYFMYGLTNDCLLEVHKRGNAETKWVVKFKEDFKWRKYSVTGSFLVPFWKKKVIEKRINNYIKQKDN